MFGTLAFAGRVCIVVSTSETPKGNGFETMFDKWELEDILIHLEYAKACLEDEKGVRAEDIRDVEKVIRLVRRAKREVN